MGRVLLIAGLSLAVVGIGLIVLARLGVSWRPLPGDIMVRRPGLVIAVPLGTMLLLSLVLTLVLNFIAWLRR
ncbi:DUF2905 family protein [bacterium]|nr:DUF2905 family protein [bacterium]